MAGADAAGALFGVVDDDDGDAVSPLQFAQIGEQRRDLAGGVFVGAVQAAGIEQAEDDPLTAPSNAVVELIHAGRLDEAEHAARDLLVRFPDVHEGYDRLGMVHEARGKIDPKRRSGASALPARAAAEE
jgi:hypothetical protein